MKATLSIVLALLFLTTASATCYFPNGDEIGDTPCDPEAEHSTCCGPGYACLSNNVCALTEHVTPDIRKLSSYYVRASCTDKNWAAKECPSFCMNGEIGDNTGIGGMGVAKCDGDGGVDRYYCRNNQTRDLSDTVICNNSTYYFDFQGFPTTATIIGVQASSVPSKVSSNSSAATTSSPPTAPVPSATTAPKKDSVALGAGLGVGLGIPLVVAIVAIALLVRRRRGSSQASQHNELYGNGSTRFVESDTGTPRPAAEKYASRHTSRRIHEATGDYGMHEAASNQVDAHELSGMSAKTEWKAI